jgi:ribosomal protein L11 methyltransferase
LNYIETKVYTTTAGIEPVAALLMRRGIVETCVEDMNDIDAVLAAKGSLGWDYVDERLTGGNEASGNGGAAVSGGAEAVLTFYTGDTEEGASLLSDIKTALMMLKADEQYGNYGDDADFGRLYAESAPLSDEWKHKWKEGFKAFRATGRIIVRPAWDADGNIPGAYEDTGEKIGGDIAGADEAAVESAAEPCVTVVIDPGMAFGTGSHETTAMCLSEIERTLKQGMGVLDIGTGSGILAIAAALLGADSVTAVEYDADAAASAASNFALNGVENSVRMIEGDIAVVAGTLGTYDIVVANLAGGLITRMAPLFPPLVAKGGRLIVSGLLADEGPKITSALAEAGVTVNRSRERGEWLTLCADFS